MFEESWHLSNLQKICCGLLRNYPLVISNSYEKRPLYIYIYILNVNDLPTKMVGIAYISYVRHLPGGRILVAPSRPSSKRDVIQQSIDASHIGFQDIPGKGENSWKKQKKLRTRALAMTDFDSAHSHYTFNQ